MSLYNKSGLILFLLATIVISGCVQQAVVPLKKRPSSEFFWVEVVFDDVSTDFLIDTGTSFPIVSRYFVERNKISRGSESIKSSLVIAPSKVGEGEPADDASFEIVRATNFSFGNIRAEPGFGFAVVDTTLIEPIVRGHLDGFVGGGILNASPYSIDFPRRKLTFGKIEPTYAPNRPLEIKKQLLFITASINGNSVQFLVDSGLMHSRISSETATRVLENSESLDWYEYQSVSILGASPKLMARTSVDSLEFGDVSFAGVSVFVSDDNVIGIDILSQGVFSVDPMKEMFSFKP